MRTLERWVVILVAVFALGGATTALAQCFYGGGEEPPPTPDFPQPQTATFAEALRNLAADLAARTNQQGPVQPFGMESGSPLRIGAFGNLLSGEKAAAAGKSPVKNFQDAIKAFEELLAKNPKDVGAQRGLLRAMSGIAGHQILSGEGGSEVDGLLLRAKLRALEALKESPNDPGLLHLLGNIESTLATRPGRGAADRAKHYGAAKSYYKQAVEGGNLFSQYALGMLYLSIGNYRGAREELRKFQALMPDAPPGLQGALEALDKAIASEPTGDFDAAFEAMMNGDEPKAIAAFLKGLNKLHEFLGVPPGQELNSAPSHDLLRHMMAHYNLAALLSKQDQLDPALNNLQQSVQIYYIFTSAPASKPKGGESLSNNDPFNIYTGLETDPDFGNLRTKRSPEFKRLFESKRTR